MGRIVKKITRPISKVLDKVIPNEIKPVLPYLAAAAPFLAPATFAAGASGIGSISGLGSMASRAALSGALNLGAQLSQEGSEGEFNPFTLALAAGSGALTDPTAGATLRGKTFASQMGDTGATRNLFEKGVDFGLEGLAKTADVMSAGATPGATLGAKLTAASAPIGIEASKSAYDAALAAQKAYEQQLSDYYKQTGEILEDNSSARIDAITSSMLNAGFGQTDIDDALRQIGLLSVGGRVGFSNGGNPYKEYLRDIEDGIIDADTTFNEWLDNNAPDPDYDYSYKVGGRVGFNSGGDTNSPIKKIVEEYDEFLKFLKKEKEKETEKKAQGGRIGFSGGGDTDSPIKKAAKDFEGIPAKYLEILKNLGYSTDEAVALIRKSMYSENKKDGGIMGLNMGGTPMEMDYRGGGFIPIGAKEKADDVPARLSKNEFVMTADAVRGMGGGDVNKGAERMYDIMNRYEAIGRA